MKLCQQIKHWETSNKHDVCEKNKYEKQHKKSQQKKIEKFELMKSLNFIIFTYESLFTFSKWNLLQNIITN